MKSQSEWNPCTHLMAKIPEVNYGIIVLNTPIDFNFNSQFIIKMWNNAKVRVTVDGGAKRWLNWLEANRYELNDVLIPDLLTGDLDSLHTEVLEMFRKSKTKVVETPDQNKTDFTKSLEQLDIYCKQENIKIDTVFVLADTCGRLDQIMANLNTMYKANSILEDVAVFQIASNSLSWVLHKGEHRILIPEELRSNHEWCALLPIGMPCQVTSTGLKWNLENGTLQFNGLVSSSNTYDDLSPVVTVQTDNPLVWSMGIDTLF
ncbi:unnamed protein product [Brassicogethes aeneus]|uniref:Thiamin pyrophosphokinase thiamin-binding domain-containing protein n=1 Tax=Brassicogethes aeneus TaxID=1431903 RepID=A0A9P0AZG3_BRAAE|nr:unnamed protein product [Brassicogethes aeneus]